MFGEPETVYLEPKTALAFGVVGQAATRKRAYSFLPISIQEKDGAITIVGKVDGSEKTLHYEKEKITEQQAAFIAWVYLLLHRYDYETRDKTKEIASEYLKEALKDDLEKPRRERVDKRWAFPYYLICRYDLDVAGVVDARAEMYAFLERREPLFPDFYKEILRQEKNPIRKVAVAKVAEKHYPEEDWFIREIADDLFDQHRYDDCIAYLLSVKKRIHEKKAWAKLDARLTLWKCYLKKRIYKAALAELEMPLRDVYFGEDYTQLLRGVTLAHQGKWKDAVPCFEDVVVRDVRDTNLAIFASYYLIECFLALKNTVKAEQVISSFKLQEDELFIYGLPFHYGEDAVRILTKASKSRTLGEETIAKLSGMLAYLLYKTLPDGNKIEGNKTKRRTRKEKSSIERALKLAKSALDFSPSEVFFNALYSELLNDGKRYDEAMDYKLKSLIRDMRVGAIYANAELANCSDEYLQNYPQKVRDTFAALDATPENYIESYGFDSDVAALWKKKLYKQVADLFLYVKPHITDYEKIGEISEHTGGTGLFEIAYSLAEVGNEEEAKHVYEKHLSINGESSAVLNNLAIICEKRGDVKKAKELIAKAKSLNGNDEIVSRNYGRIFGNKPDGGPHKQRKETSTSRRKKDKLTFDAKTGVISLGARQCEIPIGSNQHQLCKALFALPFGQWLNETDVVDDFFKGKESPRSFYDAVRLTNQKVEQGLKIPKLLAYNASRVQIRTDGLG